MGPGVNSTRPQLSCKEGPSSPVPRRLCLSPVHPKKFDSLYTVMTSRKTSSGYYLVGRTRVYAFQVSLSPVIPLVNESAKRWSARGSGVHHCPSCVRSALGVPRIQMSVVQSRPRNSDTHGQWDCQQFDCLGSQRGLRGVRTLEVGGAVSDARGNAVAQQAGQPRWTVT